jgi:Tol biopolymer transport system component
MVLACTLTMGMVVLATPARATVPGTNGRIGFGSDRFGGGDHNIFSMNPDGSDIRQITFLTADQGAALREAWSPDGTKLVFERRPADGSFRQIYEVNADGSNLHQLFSDPSFFEFDPSFSPDGSRVIFSRCRMDFEACAIYTVKTDGRGLTAVTHLDVKRNVIDSRPEYSPDGKTIVFDSINRGGVQAAVYLMDGHGTNVHRITPTALEALDPDWSPDGTSIVFVSNCCNSQVSEIWTVRPGGAGLKQLTFPGAHHDFTPSYAPEGDRIAFERDAADFSTSRILTMNPDGSAIETIQTDAFLPSWGSGG